LVEDGVITIVVEQLHMFPDPHRNRQSEFLPIDDSLGPAAWSAVPSGGCHSRES
jgi:hypothetical protein